MPDCHSALYLHLAQKRLRAASDLLARVEHPGPTHVVDLGCGPGNSTALLHQRFPEARILGIDPSVAMLAAARERLPQLAFALADLADWAPVQAPDLIYSNVSLQAVAGHEQLIPRLFQMLAPGGVLAVQMPDNHAQPSHRLLREIAQLPAFAPHLAAQHIEGCDLLDASAYYDLLSPHAVHVDVWRSTYLQPLADVPAIVQWLRSTSLQPFVAPLSDALQAAFLEAYESRVANVYPVRADGQHLLAFPHLFIVARRAP